MVNLLWSEMWLCLSQLLTPSMYIPHARAREAEARIVGMEEQGCSWKAIQRPLALFNMLPLICDR